MTPLPKGESVVVTKGEHWIGILERDKDGRFVARNAYRRKLGDFATQQAAFNCVMRRGFKSTMRDRGKPKRGIDLRAAMGRGRA